MKKTLIALMAVTAFACAQKEATIPDTAVTETTATEGQTTSDTMPVPSASADFAAKVAADGMMEVRLGEMARGKAQSSEVKEFAAMMVTDHAKANDELKAIASTRNLTVPSELPADKRQIVDRLSTLSGQEFDREYMSAMVDDHQKAVEMFQQASSAADLDPELKTFASKTLPTLQTHLARAQAISGSLK